jgi:hypothetical protein
MTENDFKHSVGSKPSASSGDLNQFFYFGGLKNKVPTTSSNVYVLQDYIERPSHLKIEGWQESGGTRVNAEIDGNTESKGKSRGVQVGPFTSSRSTSEGTITAEMNGRISDNSFSSELKYLRVSESGIFIDSDPVLDFGYEAIDRVLERDDGFTIEAGGTAYTIVGPTRTLSMALGNDGSYKSLESSELKEAIGFMQEQVEEAKTRKESGNNEADDLSDKLKELKELHEDGLLTDEEFESKKEELLDDF